MRVYVVTKEEGDETGFNCWTYDVLGVFKTRDEAKDCMACDLDMMERKYDNYIDYVSVYENEDSCGFSYKIRGFVNYRIHESEVAE